MPGIVLGKQGLTNMIHSPLTALLHTIFKKKNKYPQYNMCVEKTVACKGGMPRFNISLCVSQRHIITEAKFPGPQFLHWQNHGGVLFCFSL